MSGGREDPTVRLVSRYRYRRAADVASFDSEPAHGVAVRVVGDVNPSFSFR